MIEDSKLATLPQTTSHAGMSYIILRTAMWLLTQRVYVTGPACRKLKMRFQESVQEESSIVTLSFTSCRGVGTLTAAGRNWRLKTRVWTVIKMFFVNQKPLKTTVCSAACWPRFHFFRHLGQRCFIYTACQFILLRRIWARISPSSEEMTLDRCDLSIFKPLLNHQPSGPLSSDGPSLDLFWSTEATQNLRYSSGARLAAGCCSISGHKVAHWGHQRMVADTHGSAVE